MKSVLLILLSALTLWGDIFFVDGENKTALMQVPHPKVAEAAPETLPHIRRDNATITLQFEGEAYNHRHLNVQLATLEAHPVHTVLTEYSETIAPDVYRVTFSGYRYYEKLMLQVYYCGQWYVAILEALEKPAADETDGAAEDTAPDDKPAEVLSYQELDELLDHLRR